ncbi:hypothetical protein CEXT_55741 [Caerostris extrusa]|uniref:Uncharacterized protein n=1 Tax=Caerostris extrusa TaxID=172846 RepID=A0AAV4WJQ8_CAEEX|nr:hypothetical protein CEXT_55741 [Caerostris extrusa]
MPPYLLMIANLTVPMGMYWEKKNGEEINPKTLKQWSPKWGTHTLRGMVLKKDTWGTPKRYHNWKYLHNGWMGLEIEIQKTQQMQS